MINRPHWSFSAINQYLRCPLQFFFERVLGLPQPTVSSNLVLGSAVHRTLEAYHRNLMQGRTVGITDLWERDGRRPRFQQGEGPQCGRGMRCERRASGLGAG
jgi:CRISPR/Cas system-associated exonuclease Cas4 (RecB family)